MFDRMLMSIYTIYILGISSSPFQKILFLHDVYKGMLVSVLMSRYMWKTVLLDDGNGI